MSKSTLEIIDTLKRKYFPEDYEDEQLEFEMELDLINREVVNHFASKGSAMKYVESVCEIKPVWLSFDKERGTWKTAVPASTK